MIAPGERKKVLLGEGEKRVKNNCVSRTILWD